MSGDYKVLVVVDLQNCFIQGGSLGSQNIEDLKKYIDLVKEVDNKIHQNNYDLVVFSKDSHPLNHSSLSDNTDSEHGVFNYHCRNTKKNCIKDTLYTTTYISSAAKEAIRDILCDVENVEKAEGRPSKPYIPSITDNVKENFYNTDYTKDDYNFYNPKNKELFTYLLNLQENKNKVIEVMNDVKVNIDEDKIKTLEVLINEYLSNQDLDDDSKGYLKGLKSEKYKGLKVRGLDLNYLFYNTELKDIIYALNTNTDSEIGIKGSSGLGNKSSSGLGKTRNFININDAPNYDDKVYNVDKLTYYTKNNTRFITIEKGQYCDYESYSAFNYHTKIKKQYLQNKSIIYKVFGKYDSSLNDLEKLPAEKRYSTGLFEYILKDFLEQGGSKTNINIDVCGLVTNICVINTVHQGIAMWEKVYKEENLGITCKFNLLEYLSIPLPIDIPNYLYLNYNYAQQINKEEDLGRMLLQVSNLKTLFTTKFEADVLKPNPSINDVISYTVDFDVDLNDVIKQYFIIINTTSLNFTHTNTLQTGGKKLKKTPRAAPKAVPKTVPKKAPKTPREAPKTPRAAPKTPRAAPKTPRAAPKKAPKKAPKH